MQWPRAAGVVAVVMLALGSGSTSAAPGDDRRFLDDHLLVTWYGNPRSRGMGVLGELSEPARSEALKRQAGAYAALTSLTVVPAYHLVAVVAQPSGGPDHAYRRRESADVIDRLLSEARAHKFALMLDVQRGRAPLGPELDYLLPWLSEPDVHLALDPEFAMDTGVPGRAIGSLSADEVNAALAFLQALIEARGLPPKVLVVHQFTLGMLPDKAHIRRAPDVDLTLVMDGFGSRSLKQATYRAIMRQHRLDFAGFKVFFRQDTNLFTPSDVLALDPVPSVVIYQ